MTDDLADHRRSYARDELDATDLDEAARRQPLRALRSWLDDALADGREPEPTAMVLATDDDGRPDARVVLCKGVELDGPTAGIVFYTNRRSAKGRQLATRPHAAAVFHWPTLERQVRVRGVVQPLADEVADRYFASRPRGSQLGAWASDQSTAITDRGALEQRAAAVAGRFADGAVPRPEHWGGYVLLPDELELWQGRRDRLHDRLLATRDAATTDGWRWERLQP